MKSAWLQYFKSQTLKATHQFWMHNPALCYALFSLCGFYAALLDWKSIIAPMVALVLTSGQRIIPGIILFILFFSHGSLSYLHPKLPESGILGKIHFDIESLSTAQTHFGNQWIYQGKAKTFDHSLTSVIKGKNIPLTIRLSLKNDLIRPDANRSYLIYGTLKASKNGGYIFLVDKEKPWYPIKSTWNLAEWRYHAKQFVKKYLYDKVNDTRSAEFLSGIMTGDFEDRIMRTEFSRLGLQHIMAISGFHFAIVASILGFLLRFIFNYKRAITILAFILSTYFIFLGCGPSVMRAWVMSLIGLIGLALGKPGSGLNSLGAAILAILFIDPLLSTTLGFQFSVATTAAILLFYPIVQKALEILMEKKHLGLISRMHRLDQHGYYINSVFREAMALGCAVNIVAIPITLFFFQKFPLMSLIYNLFIPFLVSLAMILVILSSLVDFFVPPLGAVLHKINQYLTSFILDYIYDLPVTLNPLIRSELFSQSIIVVYLTVVFFVGIYLVHLVDEYVEREQTLLII